MWESGNGRWRDCWKGDPTLRSFVFTLRNPCGLPPRKFPLRSSQAAHAIICKAATGPCFFDINVFEDCNTGPSSFAFNFGTSYTNDTGRNGSTLLTGAQYFVVKEIEVFEIAD
jgi:hypothetical protein